MSENEKDISLEYNSIFDQNTVTELEDVVEGREYQQAIFGQDMDGIINDVLYTRSQYIKDYSETVDNYKKEEKAQLMSILMTLGLWIMVTLLSKMLKSLGGGIIGGTATFASMIISFFGNIIVPLMLVGFLMRILRLKKLKKLALERLDARKQEHMETGTYDAGR